MTSRIRAAQLSPGAHLHQELEQRGWKQKELAQRCGCSSNLISRILSDRAFVSPNMDWKLSLVLGTPQGHWLHLQNRWIAELRGWAIIPATADMKTDQDQVPRTK